MAINFYFIKFYIMEPTVYTQIKALTKSNLFSAKRDYAHGPASLLIHSSETCMLF